MGIVYEMGVWVVVQEGRERQAMTDEFPAVVVRGEDSCGSPGRSSERPLSLSEMKPVVVVQEGRRDREM